MDTHQHTPHHHRQQRDFSRCRSQIAQANRSETHPARSPWNKVLSGVHTIRAFAQAYRLRGYERRSPKGHRSISTCDSGSLDDLEVSNTRDNRVVDLEGNPDTKIIRAVSADHAGLLSTYLYSTPSLIEIGCFFKLASDSLLLMSKVIFFPGGKVGDASSRVKTVT